MHESHVPAPENDSDYVSSYDYETTGPCTIKSVHVDQQSSIWITSNDGQKIVIPQSLRKPVAKRIREAFF
jgi:hypothetical protein